MNFCWAPAISSSSSSSSSSNSDDSKEASLPTTTSSSSPSSVAPEAFDVLEQETNFRSFTWTAEELGTSTSLEEQQSRSKFSCRSSSERNGTSDPERPAPHQGSIKWLFPNSLSLLLRPSSAKDRELEALALSPSSAGSLQEFSRALLHVYRTNTFPPGGLSHFHHMLTGLMASGKRGVVIRWWHCEVVPNGTRMIAVRVASPRDGDRLTALLSSWQSLYTVTMPLLLALLAPLNNHPIREEVLSAFRDTVLPYANLPVLSRSHPRAFIRHHWKLKQMALLLASVGPCECGLLDKGNPGDEGGHTKTHPHYEHKKKANSINEVLSILLASEIQAMGVPRKVFSQLLHLHHGGGSHHHDDGNYLHLHNIQRLESPPIPGQWLTRNPTSVLTLEELLKSAAAH